MNWLKKGPELKLPSLSSLRRSKDAGSKDAGESAGGGRFEAPGFLADLYHDLRERRLLPLIALVVVGIAAVPFLLGDSEEVAAPSLEPGGTAQSSNASGSTLAVVEANPGLRDPKKRLKGRTRTNPFRPVPTGSGSSEASEGSGGGSEATSLSSSSGGSSEEPAPIELENEEGETVTVRPAPAGTPSGSSGPGTTGPVSPNQPGIHYFGFRPDVRFGIQGSDQLKKYDELENGTRLPQKKPVAVFLGVSSDGKRALFALTPEVILVHGEEGQCIGGAQSCALLSLKAGDAVSLLTANPERTFRLSITRIQWVEVDPPEPEKASSSSRHQILDISQSFSK
ncbi:MAG TPA: hypothetical protein VH476_07110 [Solirubrobacterales bacterium]